MATELEGKEGWGAKYSFIQKPFSLYSNNVDRVGLGTVKFNSAVQ